MRVRLLGPVDVVVSGQPRAVRGARRKAVLAALALHRGEIVSTDRLADVLWGEDPPATPLNTVQSHVSYLRGVLGHRDAIVRQQPGYLLDPGRVETDVADFERLIRDGRQAGAEAGESLLHEALSLWRGRPLADTVAAPWLGEQADRLDQLRGQGLRALGETQLRLGKHAEAVVSLEELVGADPLDEQACALLMLALYRGGRQAEALAAYRRLHRALRDDLAVDPSPALRDLETAILRQDPALLGLEGSTLSPRPEPSVRAEAAYDLEPPLVEREAALAALISLAGEARESGGRVALIAGEAGVGKSVLVERLRRELPGARWLWSACEGLFTPRPLGPLHDLADQLGGELLEACARPGADRDVVFRALVRQLGAGPGLDVLVVEDVHWADDATLDLLRYLVRRLRDTPVLLVVTYRNDGLNKSARLCVTLGDLGSHRSARHVDLEPLSPAAVRALAEGSRWQPAELHRLTGGNPFYVTEILRSGSAVVPTSVRDTVLARAARLDRAPREVLEVAALIGARVEPRLISAVAAHPGGLADDLLDSGLLIADGSRVRFRHELARLAIAESVPPHRAQMVHARVLAALNEQGCDDDARMAFHAEAAGHAGAVLRHAPAAARHARDMGCHREAVAQLRRALRFAGAAPAGLRSGLHDLLADELVMLDEWPEAERAEERALGLWRAEGDRRHEGDALRRLSRIRWNLCRGREALATVAAAVDVLEPLGPSVELAWAYATFANQRMLFSDYPGAESLARRAERLAEEIDATCVRSDALDTRAVSARGQGREWTVLMREALDLALADRHQDQAARAYTNFSSLYVDERRFAEAELYLAEGIAYCEEHDLTSYAICLRGEKANMMLRQGRWDEAAALTRELLADAGAGRSASRLCGLIRLALIAVRRGEPEAAALLDEATALAQATGEPQQIIAVRLARTEAHWLAGRTAEAVRTAELADDAAAGADPWRRGEVASWLRRTGSLRPARGRPLTPYAMVPADAAAQLSVLGCPYDAALALLDAGDDASLREAQQIFTDLGAEPAARRTESLRTPVCTGC
ncbi:BTAD domain-containing putative transcriptional regulator [Actinoplanes sp. CA-030573]|uniref:BTAD domain-containing putative transcriptional regulator n=1 Tax=Actinoplanes sp. CA-030573 TaxID=3239898 RepID=UPI003D9223AE